MIIYVKAKTLEMTQNMPLATQLPPSLLASSSQEGLIPVYAVNTFQAIYLKIVIVSILRQVIHRPETAINSPELLDCTKSSHLLLIATPFGFCAVRHATLIRAYLLLLDRSSYQTSQELFS